MDSMYPKVSIQSALTQFFRLTKKETRINNGQHLSSCVRKHAQETHLLQHIQMNMHA